MDLLLYVNRHHGHRQVFAVLLILSLPHKLGIKGRVARIEHSFWLQLVVGNEIAQFLGGDIGALILVA